MLKDFVSIIFPRTCLLSGAPLASGENLVATEAILNLPKFDLSEENTPLLQRLYSFAPIEHAWSYYKFSKQGKVQKLLHTIKYRNYPELGEMAGKWFGHSLNKNVRLESIDVIVPIPLHKEKQKKRGYNQCDYIARGLSGILQIPYSNKVIVKIKNTESQTSKNRIERYHNSYHAYAIRKSANIQNRHILLVDDVITTGATLGACARLLLSGGCRSVSVAALASPE